MSDEHTDLVIQISTSGLAPDSTVANVEKTEENRLITELQRCLQPGVEIALVFEGYMALTSILWLYELQVDGSLRAGVRLLGVSALPVEQRGPAAPDCTRGTGSRSTGPLCPDSGP
jgi:hypothetical protein